jgi:predicted MFS family arabinose efflux permease
VYIVAFQIGIGSGAWLGGAFLDHGALPAVVATAALLHLFSALVVRRSQGFTMRATTTSDSPAPHDHSSARGAQ